MKIKVWALGMTVLLFGLTACSNPAGGPSGDVTGNSNENGGGGTTYTVTFNSNGGTPVPSQTIASGGKLSSPAPLGTKTVSGTQYDFAGWYKDTAFNDKWNFGSDTVTGGITLYARWLVAEFSPSAAIKDFTVDTNSKWIDAVDAISAAGNDKNYKITITGPVNVAGIDDTKFTFGTATGIIVSIRSDSPAADLHLESNGYLIKVNQNQTVFLRDISLKGRVPNDKPLVLVKGAVSMTGGAKIHDNTSFSGGGGVYVDGGVFTMKDNASVQDTTAGNSSNGGGVYVAANGVFTMQDNSSVKGSTASNSQGGGVYVAGNGEFTMKDNASVRDNAAITDGGGVYVAGAGVFTMWNYAKVQDKNRAKDKGSGVYVNGGSFTMRNNTVVQDNIGNGVYSGGGVYIDTAGTFQMREYASVSGHTEGGVYVKDGTFSMLDNTSVKNNASQSSGGGVVVGSSGTFSMRDTTYLSSNIAKDNGGGVSVEGGEFTMRDGASVSGNTAQGGSGGGVWVKTGTFTMRNSSSVSGNTAQDNGGGVNVEDGTFTMRDGASVQSNTAQTSGGGVGVEGGTFTMRDSAAVRSNNALTSGGGVWVDTAPAEFRITNGRIEYNYTALNKGRALYSEGKAQYGSYSVSWSGTDITLTNNGYEDNIRVVDGILLAP